MWIFLKGAPERVTNRCTKILINGKEEEFTEAHQKNVENANKMFGGMGERVLAFARCKLDPSVYTKNPSYEFNMSKWKDFQMDKQRDDSVPGWFPLMDLTLVGLVSLNDPPRIRVDMSVNKCRAAGIKVIMVTGDQPPTAAAIAHKVNIIRNPEMEFDKLMAANPGMTEKEALAKCQSIVIHGDKLAKFH